RIKDIEKHQRRGVAMTDHAELRRLAVAATPGARYQGTDERVIVSGNGTIICTVSGAISGPSVMADAEFLCATDPKTVLALLDEIDRLKAENEALRGALQAVEAEVDGNLRPLTRDLVNMVSGLKNGSHPNDIYEHCDEIERIIGAALEGDKQ
ncbi:ead/Ea22-like family protein, partial [Pseudomonas aeruginosa]